MVKKRLVEEIAYLLLAIYCYEQYGDVGFNKVGRRITNEDPNIYIRT